MSGEEEDGPDGLFAQISSSESWTAGLRHGDEGEHMHRRIEIYAERGED